MAAAQSGINDTNKFSKLPCQKFTPIHTGENTMNPAIRKAALAESSPRKTVLVTHHARPPDQFEPYENWPCLCPIA